MAGVRRSFLVARAETAAVVLCVVTLAGCAGAERAPAAPEGLEVADAGFMTPESVLADTVADVYLVSNINGSPFEKDSNGFISRVTPDGAVENLKWIDGAAAGVTLHAPKGMAIRGDTLFVADIDCLRRFHRVTGAAAGELCIRGATFLNDVAVGPDGSVYVTDSGLRPGDGGFAASGTDAVYRYPPSPDSAARALVSGANLGHPNGIAVQPRRIVVVTFGTGEMFQLNDRGERISILPPSENRQLDGVVFTPDGGMLFSNWADSSVYRVTASGNTSRLIQNVPSPADIGYDPRRNRVLIPVFTGDRVLIRDVR